MAAVSYAGANSPFAVAILLVVVTHENIERARLTNGCSLAEAIMGTPGITSVMVGTHDVKITLAHTNEVLKYGHTNNSREWIARDDAGLSLCPRTVSLERLPS